MSEKNLVLVNPASANGKTGRRWPELAARLRSRIDDFEVAFTEYSGHGTKLVRAAVKAGTKHIIAVGGDGTQNEVINGMFEDGRCLSDELTLSVVPAGTGGDLRRTLGLPECTLEAVNYVGNAPQTVDVGQLDYIDHDGMGATAYFINISSFGASGLIVRLVNESSKALGGRLSFLMGVIKGTLRYRNQAMKITLHPDTNEETVLTGNYYNGVIANAQYFGGGMQIAPGARMDDGLFDVVLLGDLNALQIARGTPKIYSGRHLDLKGIELYRAKRIRAEPTQDEEILIDLDGEQPGRLPATYSLLPACIQLCTGPDFAGA